MNYQAFIVSLENEETPEELSFLLKSLWYIKKGRWEDAHNIAQDVPTRDGSWVHAYLHRIEGDLWNADYWYQRAEKKRPDLSLEEEWEEIVKVLLEKENQY